jgi:hypothetical protein
VFCFLFLLSIFQSYLFLLRMDGFHNKLLQNEVFSRPRRLTKNSSEQEERDASLKHKSWPRQDKDIGNWCGERGGGTDERTILGRRSRAWGRRGSWTCSWNGKGL